MSGRTRFLLFCLLFWRNRSQVRGRGIMKKIPALIAWHCVLFFFFTCSIPGCVGNMRTHSACTDARCPGSSREEQRTKRCEHTFTRCRRGFNPSPILILAQTREKKRNKSSHRFCPVSHVAVVRDSTRAAICALAWALASVNSCPWEELGQRYCSSAWQHVCFQPPVRWHGESPVCKIRRRTSP